MAFCVLASKAPRERMTAILLGISIFCLAALSAAVSAIDTALASLDAEGRRVLRDRDPRSSRILETYSADARGFEGALMLANRMADLPLIVLCLIALQRIPFFQQMPHALAAGLMFAAVIFICEIAPKTAAIAHPVRVMHLGLPLARLLRAWLSPVCGVLQNLSESVADLVTRRPPHAPSRLTDEELHTLIVLSHEEGDLLRGETRILEEILKLARDNAKHCMTPRVDVFTIADNLSNEEAAEILRGKRYRRVPVRGESPDDILGVLDVRKFLLNSGIPYLEQLVPPAFIPETMNALELLRSFLARRQQLAIIVDEYGGIEGIVTLSDLVEEILADAAPQNEPELYIEKLGDGRILASGSARLDDLGEVLGFHWEEDGIETIGGFVLNQLGHMPRQGTRLPYNGWEITVRRATRKRIREILIEHVSGADLPAEGGLL